MRPGAAASNRNNASSIAQFPTPHLHRHCEKGQCSADWSVNEGTVNLTLPDLAISFKIEVLSMSGVHTLEMSRFDAVTKYTNWTTANPPSIGQKSHW